MGSAGHRQSQPGRLVDGHLRVEAACIRKESVVPVLYVELSELQAPEAAIQEDEEHARPNGNLS
jgi:ParB-like chromosome segregation protein Spo0J